MPLSASELRDHLTYSAWASQRLVHAASELSEAELLLDFQTSDRSVLGTLVHTFAGDRVWLARLQGAPRACFSSDADHHLSLLQNDWPEVHRQWNELAACWTDDSVAAELTYQDLRGNTWTNPIGNWSSTWSITRLTIAARSRASCAPWAVSRRHST